MIASKEEDPIWMGHFQREKKGNDLTGETTSVNIVAQEEVLGATGWSQPELNLLIGRGWVRESGEMTCESLLFPGCGCG